MNDEKECICDTAPIDEPCPVHHPEYFPEENESYNARALNESVDTTNSRDLIPKSNSGSDWEKRYDEIWSEFPVEMTGRYVQLKRFFKEIIARKELAMNRKCNAQAELKSKFQEESINNLSRELNKVNKQAEEKINKLEDMNRFNTAYIAELQNKILRLGTEDLVKMDKYGRKKAICTNCKKEFRFPKE